MKRRAEKLSHKSYDQILHERVLALSDRVREDDQTLQALVKRVQQRIRKRLLSANWIVGLSEGLSQKKCFSLSHADRRDCVEFYWGEHDWGRKPPNYCVDLALRSGAPRDHGNALDITCSTVLPWRFAMTRSSLIVCGLRARTGSAPHLNLKTACFFIRRTCRGAVLRHLT